MSSPQYRNVTLADDGTVLGEQNYALVGWVRFQASLNLLWIRWATDVSDAAAEAIWRLQDGYGVPGLTPPQGWDWSGIRDSTPQAKAAMLAVARDRLPATIAAGRLGVTTAVLERIAAANYGE